MPSPKFPINMAINYRKLKRRNIKQSPLGDRLHSLPNKGKMKPSGKINQTLGAQHRKQEPEPLAQFDVSPTIL